MQEQAFDLGVMASVHMVDADARAQAVMCACTHGQLMGGTRSGHLMHQTAQSRQLVAKGVAASGGAGAERTLRITYRAFGSVINPLTDSRQGPDGFSAPKRSHHSPEDPCSRKSRI